MAEEISLEEYKKAYREIVSEGENTRKKQSYGHSSLRFTFPVMLAVRQSK